MFGRHEPVRSREIAARITPLWRMERIVVESVWCLERIVDKSDCIAVVKKISGWRQREIQRQVMSIRGDP